jgi:heme oxygenase
LDSPRHVTSEDSAFPKAESTIDVLRARTATHHHGLGSTLGGNTILKALRSQRISTDDLHFLDPHGKQAGAYWRTFLSVLERETGHDKATLNECIAGAMKGFAFAAECPRAEGTN